MVFWTELLADDDSGKLGRRLDLLREAAGVRRVLWTELLADDGSGKLGRRLDLLREAAGVWGVLWTELLADDDSGRRFDPRSGVCLIFTTESLLLTLVERVDRLTDGPENIGCLLV